MHDALVIALGSPVHIGIYDEQGVLIEAIENGGLGSDVLPLIFDDVLKRYRLRHLLYANGPGSFMGIKVTYLFKDVGNCAYYFIV
jgi:tRNA A37 threonylcarbamoyladenosine modification protein TsaB